MADNFKIESLENTTLNSLGAAINPPYDFERMKTDLAPILQMDALGDANKIDAGLET